MFLEHSAVGPPTGDLARRTTDDDGDYEDEDGDDDVDDVNGLIQSLTH